MQSVKIENKKLIACERPEPSKLGAHDVKIKVAAIGINRADLYFTRGEYRMPAGSPDFPGMEISGEVIELGADARKFKVGDKVCALLAGGGYAETIVVMEALVMEAPQGVSLEHAAALPEAMATVYLNLFLLGRLKMTERVLIHGGTSGIGVMAIQMAKAFGAEVFATCGSPEKCQLAQKLGAFRAYNYNTEDFSELKDVDVVLDIMGGMYLEKNLKVLGHGGRLLVIGLIGGSKAELPMGQVLLKNLSIIGSTLASHTLQEKYQILEALREFWWPRVERGEIKPVIDEVFPLSKAQEALERMQEFSHTGKILLKPVQSL